jgi:hypothetical protein
MLPNLTAQRFLIFRGKKSAFSAETTSIPGLPDGLFSNKKYLFGKIFEGKCWYVLCPFGPFHSHLVHFVAIWYILKLFGLFFPVLVQCCTKKNLATLVDSFSSSLDKINWL